jgi:hypothetical protein
MWHHTPTIAVTNTYPYTLRKLCEMHGGTIDERLKPPGRPYYQWRVYGDQAMDLIQLIHPYLWEKLPQADLILRIRDTTPGPRREGLIAQLKHLKRLDYT